MKKRLLVVFLILLLIPFASADPFTDWFRGLFGITGRVTADQISWRNGISSCSSIGCSAVTDNDCALCRAKYGADKGCETNDLSYGPAYYSSAGKCKAGSADLSRAWSDWYKACDCGTYIPTQTVTPPAPPAQPTPAASSRMTAKCSGDWCLGNAGENCNTVCSRQGKICVQSRFRDVNACSFFSPFGSCNCDTRSWWAADQPAYVSDSNDENFDKCLGYTGNTAGASCEASYPSVMRLCPCGTATPTCTNDCSFSSKRCKPGANIVQLCANYDTDSCYEWGDNSICSTNQVCNNNNCCTPTCPSANTINCGAIDSRSNGCGGSCNVVGTKCASGTCQNSICVSTAQQASTAQQSIQVNQVVIPEQTKTCGNFKLDAGEICDPSLSKKKCDLINPNYYSTNYAQCENNCSGWDTSDCRLRQTLIQTTPVNETNITTTPESNITIQQPQNVTNETCSTSLDGVCPVICSPGVDADCCKNSGKFWLKTSFGYGCYVSDYNPGCYGNETCGSQIDGCCPNWCAAGSDADCCAIIGKNFVINEFGVYVCNESANITEQILQTSSQASVAQQAVLAQTPTTSGESTGKAKTKTSFIGANGVVLSGDGLRGRGTGIPFTNTRVVLQRQLVTIKATPNTPGDYSKELGFTRPSSIEWTGPYRVYTYDENDLISDDNRYSDLLEDRSILAIRVKEGNGHLSSDNYLSLLKNENDLKSLEVWFRSEYGLELVEPRVAIKAERDTALDVPTGKGGCDDKACYYKCVGDSSMGTLCTIEECKKTVESGCIKNSLSMIENCISNCG
mgnify:CR=1 FL=1